MRNSNPKKEPRRGYRLRLAASAFSLLLVVNGLGLQAANLEAAELYQGVRQQAARAYASVAGFASHLRLFYELSVGLEELAGQAPSASSTADGPSGSYRCTATALPAR